jgi:autotransporter-associated beta strand protein
MKLRTSLFIATALVLPAALPAATFTWTGTSTGAWNPATTANWNGATPIFGNTADIVFNGDTPIVTYGTWLGDGDRTVRSLTFSNIATQLEIRTNSNGPNGRILTYAADSGNATITVNSTVSAPIIIGAVAGNQAQSDNGSQLLASDLDIIHNGSALLTMRRPIDESGGARSITKSGSGTVLFNGSLNYTGLTTISGGTLEINTGTPMSGDIVNDASFVSSGNANRTLAGDISGTGSLTKRGTHVLTLTGTNSFEGGIVLENGNIDTGTASIGSGAITMAGTSNATRLLLNDGIYSNDILFADGATANKVVDVATTTSHVELTGTITFADDSTTNSTSRIAPVGGTIVISGQMTGTGTGGYAKRNSGTVVITGTDNDYTGPTTIVDTGTLLVDGSIQSNVLFGQNLNGSGGGTTSGTLGGSGLINANVTTQGASNLSPGGASNAGVNTHTVDTLSIGGNLDISLSAAGIGLITMQLGTDSDLIDLVEGSGALTIGSGVLGFGDFNFIAESGFGSGGIGSFYTLIATNYAIIGSLDPADLNGNVSGFDVQLGFSDSGSDLILTVVPEPHAALLGGLGVLALLRRRR